MTRRVRWGILGTATIAREAIVPAFSKSHCAEVAELVAIASRSLPQAQRMAHACQIPRAFGSYAELLQAAEIDAVYIPLPNHLHVPWAIQALELGKHVLCEKPLAPTAPLLAAAARFPRLRVMEAFMYRFHPQWQWARQVVQEHRLGAIRAIQTWFSFFDDNPASILHHAEWGGGALLDIGCYPISLSRWLFARQPRRVWGALREDEAFGVDRLTSGELDFGDAISTFTVATHAVPFQRVQLFGDQGRLELEVPFNPPTDRPTRGWLEQAGQVQELVFPVCDQYALQLAAISTAILHDTPVPTPLGDGLANLRVSDALVASSQQEAWVAVK